MGVLMILWYPWAIASVTGSLNHLFLSILDTDDHAVFNVWRQEKGKKEIKTDRVETGAQERVHSIWSGRFIVCNDCEQFVCCGRKRYSYDSFSGSAAISHSSRFRVEMKESPLFSRCRARCCHVMSVFSVGLSAPLPRLFHEYSSRRGEFGIS